MADYPGQRRVRTPGGYQRFDLRLWLAWVAATTVGWAAGEVVYQVFADTFFVAAWLRGSHGIGVFVAVLQALALRRYLEQPGWWILASGVGGVLGPVLSTVIGARVYEAYGVHGVFVVTLALTALGLGILIGTLQWLVLRGQVARAGRWVPVSSVGMVVSWFVGGLVGYVFVESILNLPDDLTAFGIAQGLVSAIFYGAITGYALVRLLESQAFDAAVTNRRAPTR